MACNLLRLKNEKKKFKLPGKFTAQKESITSMDILNLEKKVTRKNNSPTLEFENMVFAKNSTDMLKGFKLEKLEIFIMTDCVISEKDLHQLISTIPENLIEFILYNLTWKGKPTKLSYSSVSHFTNCSFLLFNVAHDFKDNLKDNPYFDVHEERNQFMRLERLSEIKLGILTSLSHG